jgi:membrane protein YdbS with pleckstrin-like domain
MSKNLSSSQDAPVEPVTRPPVGGGHTDSKAANLSLEAGDGAALAPGAERDLWVGRTHWKHYAGRLSLWLAGNVLVIVLLWWLADRVKWLGAAGVFWLTVAILVISGLLVVGRVFLTILGHRYRLTTQRLFIERGILSQTVDQTELIRVDDVRLYKSLLDRLFGLGSVALTSTDASDREVLIVGVAEPDKVAEAIRSHMRVMRRKSLFVENL